MNDRTLESIAIGESATLARTITAANVDAFAELSGDNNPLHVDEAYAQKTVFGKRVVHGMLLGGLVSQLVGMQLPGRRALLLKESLEFKKPVFIGDTVVVKGKVTHKSDAAQLVELSIEILRNKEVVALGDVHVRLLQ